MLDPAVALARLREGNRRFAAGRSRPLAGRALRPDLVAGQAPFAIVLGCSDSRVPAELVFDQGFGDLFVIRVAGNIVAPSQVGSVEFAASRFGTRLAVVLGHSRCGAVLATLEELAGGPAGGSPNLRAIVDRVRPGVEPVLASRPGGPAEAVLDLAVRANVRAAVEQLRHGSALLERLGAEGGLAVVGALYALETGIVEFLDEAPGGAG
jgi:carbonic anhydrase